jgi:ribosomal subunit interface protein
MGRASPPEGDAALPFAIGKQTMNVSYKGIQKALAPKLQEKLDAKFGKLSKLLEKRGPKEAHVVVASERGRHKAEVMMHFYGHPLVGMASSADLFTALWEALHKLEAQAVKQGAKWREKQRRSETSPQAPPSQGGKKAAGAKNNNKELVGVVSGSDGKFKKSAVRIFRVNHRDEHKPMTLDEALLEMEKGQDYMVYQDAGNEGLSVLVRRKDGHFDLIES